MAILVLVVDMRRKEIKARSINQSNDASCHSPRPNGHKSRAGLKRQASKKGRQALADDLADRAADDLAAQAQELHMGYDNPLKPDVGLLVKLGSIAVHAEEFLSPGGHQFDRAALDGLFQDHAVRGWIEQMTRLALLPVRR